MYMETSLIKELMYFTRMKDSLSIELTSELWNFHGKADSSKPLKVDRLFHRRYSAKYSLSKKYLGTFRCDLDEPPLNALSCAMSVLQESQHSPPGPSVSQG